MAWIRLDDQIAHHPKFLKAGPIASWLWVCCIGYSQKFLTDGFVPNEALGTLGAVPDAETFVRQLVQAGLLSAVDNGYQIHDYLDFNESAAVVKRRRLQDRVRKESERNPAGIRAESSRNPSGIQPESERNPAGVLARAPASHPIPSVPILKEKKKSGGNGRVKTASKRPIFQGQRFVVFEWMLEDLARILGPHTEAFDLHAWFFELDTLSVNNGLVIPKNDAWLWLQKQLEGEIHRRHLPVADLNSTRAKRPTWKDLAEAHRGHK